MPSLDQVSIITYLPTIVVKTHDAEQHARVVENLCALVAVNL